MSEYPSAYGQEIRKARKAHRCCECWGTIEAGEQYHYHHGVWDGQGRSYKVCVDCEALRADADKGAPRDERTCFEELYQTAECHNNPEITLRFIEIMRKRGAKISQGWIDLENARREER